MDILFWFMLPSCLVFATIILLHLLTAIIRWSFKHKKN